MMHAPRPAVVVTFPASHLDHSESQALLQKAGLEIRLVPKVGPRSVDEVQRILRDATAAIVSTDPLDESVFAACQHLRVISRVGVGLDSVDLTAATRAGIVVTTTPGANEETAADHTLALMLAVLRRIVENDASVRRGEWDRGRNIVGSELHRRKVGLIGCGSIGRAVARRLRGFDVTILAYDVRPQPLDGIEFVGLDEVLQSAEIVSIHVPLDDSTRGLIASREFELLRPDAIIINTSRGAVIDEVILVEALRTGRVRAAGIDVFASEPPAASSLLALPNVTLSPHVAGVSAESVRRMLYIASESVVDVLAGRIPKTAINPSALDHAGSRQWSNLHSSPEAVSPDGTS